MIQENPQSTIGSADTFCRRCGAGIRFFKNPETGKWMPVDRQPIRVHPGQQGVFILEDGRALSGAKILADCWGYISHFATCPKAKEFRK